ncbi:MAG: PAS domain S-box protein, partial [bacterium]|nr:PAS domain S-box protein [bacterium]
MREWIARLTHPGRFRPGLVLAAAVGATALFSAVIAVNVQLAHHRLHEATRSAARLGGLVEEVSDLHEQLTGVMFKAVSLGDPSAEADHRRISGSIDDILQSFDSTPGREPVPGTLSAIRRAHDRLKASELQVFRWVDAGYPDSALAALHAPQYTRADHDFHGAVHQTTRQLTVFRAELADRFTHYLLIIALVTAVFVLMLSAVWIVIVLMTRRFYQAQTRTETALRESELRYRTLFDHVGDHILVLEPDEQGLPIIVDVNEAVVRACGYSRAEMVGKPVTLIDPDLSPRVILERKRLIGSDPAATFQARHRRKDGSEFLVESRGTMVRIGQKDLLLTVERDITERVRIQEALRESEERFRQVAESAGEWIWEVDAQGLYTYSNAVVEKILGYTPQEIVGKVHFYELFTPEVRDEFKAAAL